MTFEADGLSCRFDNEGNLTLELFKEDSRANGHIVYMTAADVNANGAIFAAWAKRRVG